MPKFELDRNNKEISNFLLNTSETNVKFVLIKNSFICQDERIVEFGVDLGELILFCDDMSKARIKSYPIIVFEFTKGFYTTRDLYVNNTFNYQLEPFNNLMINSFALKNNQSRVVLIVRQIII